MERKLHKCPCCKEWFNTTDSIMLDHYRDHHGRAFMASVMVAQAYMSSMGHIARILRGLHLVDVPRSELTTITRV